MELLAGEVWQVSKRNSQYFRSYLRKTTGPPPPSGARVNIWDKSSAAPNQLGKLRGDDPKLDRLQTIHICDMRLFGGDPILDRLPAFCPTEISHQAPCHIFFTFIIWMRPNMHRPGNRGQRGRLPFQLLERRGTTPPTLDC